MANRIVIEVGGGNACEVYSDDPRLEVVLVDWDTAGVEPGDQFVHTVGEPGGGRLVLVVPGYPTARPEKMPDDTRSALELAGVISPPLTLAGLAKEGVKGRPRSPT
ncbi:MAG: hypothetical protein ABGY75_09910 [Gemmataceae bacterium]